MVKHNSGLFAGFLKILSNAIMPSQMVKDIYEINVVDKILLKTDMESLDLSVSAYNRILKVSRTIANLADSRDIKKEHLAEAIQYRS